MSASARAMEAQPNLFKKPTLEEFNALPAIGNCQKCRKAVDLKQEAHSCGG